MKLDSPFAATSEKTAFSFKEKERVVYGFKDFVKEYDPENPDDFTLEERIVEISRVPIEEDIESHRNKCGLKNLLQGIVSQKQMNDLINKTKSTGVYVDLTKIPDSHLAMEKLAASIDSLWDTIPQELKGSLTKEEFTNSITSKKVESYLSSKLKEIEASNASKANTSKEEVK